MFLRLLKIKKVTASIVTKTPKIALLDIFKREKSKLKLFLL